MDLLKCILLIFLIFMLDSARNIWFKVTGTVPVIAESFAAWPSFVLKRFCCRLIKLFMIHFITLRYGSDWCSALLTVMLLSFIWNLLYLTLDSQFSHSGSSGTCRGSTETAACHWEEADESRVGIPGAGKVTNGLDLRMCTTAPRGPGRSHVSSLSHWYALCTFYTFHEIRLQEPEPWARNAVLVSEGFLHNNRPLWPWVKEKDRERGPISWLIAPGGSLNLVCV